jgi:hypothetical protein
VPVDDPSIGIGWSEGETGGAMPSAEYLDLRREIGFRVQVVHDASSADLTVQWHHACCDGAGMFSFVTDFLIAYALQRGEDSPDVRLREVDARRLAGRGRYGLSAWRLAKMIPRQLVGLVGAAQFFGRRPAPVLPHGAVPDDDPPPPGYPTAHTHVLTVEETRLLRRAARRCGVRLNDLLARDLFLALGEWRARHGAGDRHEWLRMMVPMNLRDASDRLLPAANVVSSVFLDRRGEDCDDANQLLEGIHDEMELIKSHQLGLTFVFSLRLFGLLPGGLRRYARKDRCNVSVTFTNLGTLTRTPLPMEDGFARVGDVVLRDIDSIVPTGPYNCVTFSAHVYARRLTFTLHYDPRPVSDRQAVDLLETLVRHLRASCEARG